MDERGKDLPEPLVPPEVDLRKFRHMSLDVERLRDSDLVALSSGDEFRAALMLWCASWHQVPAASLPNDDRMLARLAGYGRDFKAWNKVKDGALHGFVLCTDGRLYHPVVAEKAREAWAVCEQRRAAGRSSAAKAAARREQVVENAQDEIDDRSDEQTEAVATGERMSVAQEKRKEKKREDNTVETDFDDLWWPEVPLKVSKGAARKAYRRARKKVDAETLLQGIKSYARQVNGSDPKFIKHPANWLNDECWADEDSRGQDDGFGIPNFLDRRPNPDIWRDRVKDWWNDGEPEDWRWSGNWGMRPNEGHCNAPPEIVKEVTGLTLAELQKRPSKASHNATAAAREPHGPMKLSTPPTDPSAREERPNGPAN